MLPCSKAVKLAAGWLVLAPVAPVALRVPFTLYCAEHSQYSSMQNITYATSLVEGVDGLELDN